MKSTERVRLTPEASRLNRMIRSRRALALAASSLMATLAWCGLGGAAQAQQPWSYETPAPYAIIIDATTGDVLTAKEPDTQIPTASLSKLMTALLAFEALDTGVAQLEATYEVSEAAFRAGQDEVADDSLMWLNRGDAPTMDDLLRGLIIQSGNDAAIAIAEAVGGDETFFVRRMNAKAEELGLTNTHYANASGVDHPEHYMSVRDLATLTLHIIAEYPEYLHYYSELEFTWAGVRQESRNPLLGTYVGADGMKTGYTENARYAIVGTAVRDGRRVVVVLSGMDSIAMRAREARRALDWAFARFAIVSLAEAGDVVGSAEVWLGAEETVPLALAEDLTMALPKEVFPDEIEAVIRYEGPLQAPVAAGREVGELIIRVPGMAPRRAVVVTAAAVEEGGYIVRAEAAAAWAFGMIETGDDAEAASEDPAQEAE